MEGDRLVGDLPAVAEDAMEDGAAPQRREPGYVRGVVAEPVREQDRANADAGDALGARHGERRTSSVALEVEHLGLDDLDARKPAQLAAAGAPQRRRRALLAEQPADRARHAV